MNIKALSNKTHRRILALLLALTILIISFTWDRVVPESKAASNYETCVALQIHMGGTVGIKVPVIDDFRDKGTSTLMCMTATNDDREFRAVYCVDHGKGFKSSVYADGSNVSGQNGVQESSTLGTFSSIDKCGHIMYNECDMGNFC